MEKSYLKHILALLDNYEIRGISLQQAVDDLYAQLRTESNKYPSKKKLTEDLNKIIDAGMMHKLTRGYDVTPNATIFAHCMTHSLLEDLSLFACIFSNDNRHPLLKECLFRGPITKEQLKDILPDLLFDIALQCRLFTPLSNGLLSIPNMILHDCIRIANEYEENIRSPLVSPTILCYYLKTIYPTAKEGWKNKDKAIIPYPYLSEILTILPKRGIPNNRDESKQLQSFYKDTLFHEFDHCCPICNIHLPHMLIASHIKPFRDCAHLYEPIDNNNGLLLCRNHDYLFDQGYISFADNGKLLVCNELKKETDYAKTYSLPADFQLEERLLSNERRLFLQYHRKNIFQH